MLQEAKIGPAKSRVCDPLLLPQEILNSTISWPLQPRLPSTFTASTSPSLFVRTSSPPSVTAARSQPPGRMRISNSSCLFPVLRALVSRRFGERAEHADFTLGVVFAARALPHRCKPAYNSLPLRI